MTKINYEFLRDNALEISGTINWSHFYYNGKYYFAQWDSAFLRNNRNADKRVRGWVVGVMLDPFLRFIDSSNPADKGSLFVFRKDWQKNKQSAPQYISASKVSDSVIKVDETEMNINDFWSTYYTKP